MRQPCRRFLVSHQRGQHPAPAPGHRRRSIKSDMAAKIRQEGGDGIGQVTGEGTLRAPAGGGGWLWTLVGRSYFAFGTSGIGVRILLPRRSFVRRVGKSKRGIVGGHGHSGTGQGLPRRVGQQGRT
ncbi:hypothetical protein OF83DRAFT_1112716 [Amylostereum chailletii]|nr:hypothetical protein OF83DRAFT_1112716 [Amylostereum chailletii]